jgi:DNA-binding IclR family transcriptional regulator
MSEESHTALQALPTSGGTGTGAPGRTSHLISRSVPAVLKVLAILETLAESRNGLTLNEISQRCSVPKSSVHCILLTLERGDYVRRNPLSHRYRPARKLVSLANTALANLDVSERAQAVLRRLALHTGLVAHLGILDNLDVVLVARSPCPSQVREIPSWLGMRMSIHSTALGKALIAHWTRPELDRLYKERGLPRHNENTICSRASLLEELESVRRSRYAIEDEEDALSIRCVAAPVFGRTGAVEAAIGVGGTSEEVTADNLQSLAPQVMRAADTLTRELAQQMIL